MGKNSIGDASDYVAKGKWYPGEKQMRANRLKADVPKGDDPLWCVVCRKRFGSQGVFDSHLTGKKHIGALRAAGRVKEAEAMKQRIVDERNRAELAKAQELAVASAKRTRPASESDEQSGREKKIAKSCFEAGGFQRQGKAAAAAAPSTAAAAAKSAAAPPDGGSAAAAAAAAAPPLSHQYSRPNPNGLEWWKGVPSTEDPEEEGSSAHLSALERLLEKRATNRSGKDGPVRSNDWQCPGNYYTKKECGVWNYASNQTCHACGATRRATNVLS